MDEPGAFGFSLDGTCLGNPVPEPVTVAVTRNHPTNQAHKHLSFLLRRRLQQRARIYANRLTPLLSCTVATLCSSPLFYTKCRIFRISTPLWGDFVLKSTVSPTKNASQRKKKLIRLSKQLLFMLSTSSFLHFPRRSTNSKTFSVRYVPSPRLK